MPEATITTATRIAGKNNFRWLVIALAAFITLVNYLDRSAIAYAIGSLKAEFGLNNQDFGLIAAAFGLGYLLMTFLGGMAVDLWGARKIWSGAAFAWSVITALLGTCTGFWTLFSARAALGLAEGPHFPALTRVVADWLPDSEQAKATAWGLSTVPLASVIGAPLISHLIIGVGWKAMFFILGGIGIAWSVVWLVLFRDHPQNSRFVSGGELEQIRGVACLPPDSCTGKLSAHTLEHDKTSIQSIISNPCLLSNNYAFFAFGYLLFFAVNWLPGYLQQTYGLGLQETGYLLMVPWATAATLLVVGGYMCDWLLAKTGNRRIARSHMIWICQLLSAACLVPVITIHCLAVAVLFISLGLGIGLMPNAAFYALNSDLVEDRVATSSGIMTGCLALAGILAPALTGALANATGNFNSALALLIGFTVTSAAGIILFQHPDPEPPRTVTTEPISDVMLSSEKGPV